MKIIRIALKAWPIFIHSDLQKLQLHSTMAPKKEYYGQLNWKDSGEVSLFIYIIIVDNFLTPSWSRHTPLYGLGRTQVVAGLVLQLNSVWTIWTSMGKLSPYLPQPCWKLSRSSWPPARQRMRKLMFPTSIRNPSPSPSWSRRWRPRASSNPQSPAIPCPSNPMRRLLCPQHIRLTYVINFWRRKKSLESYFLAPAAHFRSAESRGFPWQPRQLWQWPSWSTSYRYHWRPYPYRRYWGYCWNDWCHPYHLSPWHQPRCSCPSSLFFPSFWCAQYGAF